MPKTPTSAPSASSAMPAVTSVSLRNAVLSTCANVVGAASRMSVASSGTSDSTRIVWAGSL